jgi:hypothetical protein
MVISVKIPVKYIKIVVKYNKLYMIRINACGSGEPLFNLRMRLLR